MLSLWVLICVLKYCACGGLYASAPGTSTVEGHGPLARQAVNSMGQTGHYNYPAATPFSYGALTPAFPAPTTRTSFPQVTYAAPAFLAARQPPFAIPQAQLATAPVTYAAPASFARAPLSIPRAPVTYAAPAPFTRAPLSIAQAPVTYTASAQFARTPLSIAPAPVTYAAPGQFARTPVSIAPAPVPLAPISHVPAVADVPVTQYFAQPGYVKKIVHVATPKVATAKVQVRRPAIQKQFYDIEQRTIIRPVGSAVVELEEPLSKNLVSPISVAPARHRQTVTKYLQPFSYPVSSYPFVPFGYPAGSFQVPAQGYQPTFIQQTQVIPQKPEQTPKPSQNPQQPQDPQQPSDPEDQPPQQSNQPSGPSFDNSIGNEEFDPSDTVAVDNPDFGRRVEQPNENMTPQQQNPISNNTSEDAELEDLGKQLEQSDVNQQPLQTIQQPTDQEILDVFQRRQLFRTYWRQGIPPFQLAVLVDPPQTVQRDQTSQTPQINQESTSSEPTSTEAATSSESDIGPENDDSISTSTESSISSTSESQQTESSTSSTSDSLDFESLLQSSFGDQEITRAASARYSSQGQIPSVRNLSPEEAQKNQQRLIELLTGRGEVSEIGLSRSGVQSSAVGDSGLVRGRVLSVTPAPEGLNQTEEVSTRRVVVSRPIQTLEEIDVQQPFTKLERVAVHQPTILKTARTHIARVPTSVPFASAPIVYG